MFTRPEGDTQEGHRDGSVPKETEIDPKECMYGILYIGDQQKVWWFSSQLVQSLKLLGIGAGIQWDRCSVLPAGLETPHAQILPLIPFSSLLL